MSLPLRHLSAPARRLGRSLAPLARAPGLNLTTSVLASTAAGWRGAQARVTPTGQSDTLTLYEYEGCPYCRLVREAITELDLDVHIRPCPAGGTRYRPEAERIGGKSQFPMLVINDEPPVYESAEIIRLLYTRFGQGKQPRAAWRRPFQLAGAEAASLLRGFGALSARGGSRPPEQPLVLYSFEASPYSRPVRETLCELEIPYLLKSFGKARLTDIGPPAVRTRLFPKAPVASRNRQEMLAKTGRTQVPYLEDPNTGVAMFESADINRYLHATYG